MKLALLLFLPLLLQADGGKLILTATNSGETLSVFADPFPLRVHQRTDVSVLVQNAAGPVLTGTATLHLGTQNLKLTHAAATNKLLFAASVEVSQAGEQSLTVHHDGATINGSIVAYAASPRGLSYWPFAVAVPVSIGLFALNRYLKRQRLKPVST